MSDFKFACPHCAQRLRVDERHAGRQILCPKCQHLIVIPAPPTQSMAARSQAPEEEHTGVTLSPLNTLPPASPSAPTSSKS